MNNQDNVIVTPWKIEEVPLDHWFRHKEISSGGKRITGVVDGNNSVVIGGIIVHLSTLAEKYLHSEHPVGDKADWQRCGHIEPRGVVWVGRDDLYFRRDTAVINGVRYAVDGAEPVTVELRPTNEIYQFSVTSGTNTALVTRDGLWQVADDKPYLFDVVPAIRMEAK